ncbi:MAG: cytidine deaminase [Bacteroidetes bacterium HGW-Bacteroidetes-12]|jgi:cytidine deaminase|nr:MAG: cytidine deaminase [Bacteroidetes bacterium HGW-Bacteroidetes-12]
MNKKSITISFEEHENNSTKISSETKLLLAKAEQNLNNAYAPYSTFKVSSAVRLKNGEIILGTNQENAAYPSGICAERVAVFYAGATFPNEIIEEIAIVTETSNETPFSPCGACRQVLLEYEYKQKQPIKVVLKSGNSKIWCFSSISDLLPFAFDGSSLLKQL